MELLLLPIVLLIGYWVYQGYANHTPQQPTRTREELVTRTYLTPYKLPAKAEKSDPMYISAEQKQAHLRSAYWYNLKQQRRDICNNLCEQCNLVPPTELHHLHYTNLLHESIDDVVYLCTDCHQAIHNIYGYDRASTYPLLQPDSFTISSMETVVMLTPKQLREQHNIIVPNDFWADTPKPKHSYIK